MFEYNLYQNFIFRTDSCTENKCIHWYKTALNHFRSAMFKGGICRIKTDSFFNRDGHHRILVARSFGQTLYMQRLSHGT